MDQATSKLTRVDTRKDQEASFQGRVAQIAYRIRDVLFSGLGLLALSPFFAMIAVMIKRDTPGPVFYWGPRAGKNGTRFKILKFRTMYEHPESYNGAKITAENDSRITPVGKWLRDTKLNELPQLWNVLKGEMSLVGPRPEDPDIVDEWLEEVRQEILSVRPGITSPASVHYNDEESLLDGDEVMSSYFEAVLPSKLRLDQLYVRDRSFWMDLDVLFWTLLVLIPQIPAIEPPEEQLFWGPMYRFFQRYFSWFMIDFATSFIAFAAASAFWRLFGPLNLGWLRVIGISLSFALLFSLIGAIMGIQRIYWSKARAADMVYLIPAVGVAAILSLIVNYYFSVFPLGLIIFASGLAFLGFVFVRYRSRLFTGLAGRLLQRRSVPAISRERVLIIGGGDAGQLVAWMLEHHHESGAFHVIGFVDDDLYKQGVRIRGAEVLGRREDIPELVEGMDVGILVFAIHNITLQEQSELLRICDQTPARLLLLPDFLGKLNAITSMKKDDVAYPPSSGEAFSPTFWDNWLKHIEDSVRSGKVATSLAEIEAMRTRVRTWGQAPDEDWEAK